MPTFHPESLFLHMQARTKCLNGVGSVSLCVFLAPRANLCVSCVLYSVSVKCTYKIVIMSQRIIKKKRESQMSNIPTEVFHP